jgi:hypothetical protein
MTRKEHLLKLMQKKEQIKMQRQATTVGSLAQQVDSSQSLINKLTTLQAENQEISGLVSPQHLRSRSWYGRYMSEQQELAQNRLEFLEAELKGARNQLARSSSRNTILDDRRIDARREGQEEKEELQDRLMPPRSGQYRG